MAVPVNIAATFDAGLAEPLFAANSVGFFPYDVARDGRFLVLSPIDSVTSATSPITIVMDWTAVRKN